MSKMKFEPIESRNYRVVIPKGNNSYWFIERKIFPMDMVNAPSTKMFIGAEGWNTYQDLKQTWRESKPMFDKMCDEYWYT